MTPCCDMMAEHARHACAEHDQHDCPDVLVITTKDGLALPVRDGGASFVPIRFCPWCGVPLGKDGALTEEEIARIIVGNRCGPETKAPVSIASEEDAVRFFGEDRGRALWRHHLGPGDAAERIVAAWRANSLPFDRSMVVGTVVNGWRFDGFEDGMAVWSKDGAIRKQWRGRFRAELG